VVDARPRDPRQDVGVVTSVGIIEDHPVFRQGLAQVIEAEEGLTLLFAVRSVEEFETVRARPDVVILDLNLGGLSGAEAVAAVCGRGVPVLVVSADGGQQQVLDAIAAGASGYLTKSAEPSEIARALSVVAGRGSYVSPTLAAFFLRAARGDPGVFHLTDREREILRLVAGGERDQDIAEQLYISVRTVRSHLDRIRDKTGRRRRPDLTRLALEQGIVPRREDDQG
jgi:DNA-binding NarL/FixJ family response regulator